MDIKAYIYIFLDGEHKYLSDGFVKIGKTTSPISNRLATLQIGNPRQLKILSVVSFDNYDLVNFLETQIHKHLAKHKARGEWFCYHTEEVRKFIKRIEGWGSNVTDDYCQWNAYSPGDKEGGYICLQNN